MSTEQGPLFLPPQYSGKQVELVRRIIEKTQQGKILWSRTKTGMSATVKGQMSINFVRSALPFLTGSQWALFAIRDAQGNEIVKVEKGGPPAGIIAALAGVTDPLLKAVDELYAVVNAKAKGEIEKAIDLIDNL